MPLNSFNMVRISKITFDKVKSLKSPIKEILQKFNTFED